LTYRPIVFSLLLASLHVPASHPSYPITRIQATRKERAHIGTYSSLLDNRLVLDDLLVLITVVLRGNDLRGLALLGRSFGLLIIIVASGGNDLLGALLGSGGLGLVRSSGGSSGYMS